MERKDREVFGPGHDALWGSAVYGLRPGPLLLHDVPGADGVEEAQGGAVHAVVRVRGFDGLEEVPHMTDVDPGLTHGVGLLHHLDEAPLLESLDSLKLGKVVQSSPIQLEGETGAVARVLPVHEQLVDLLDKLHAGHLNIKGLHPGGSNLHGKSKILKYILVVI